MSISVGFNSVVQHNEQLGVVYPIIVALIKYIGHFPFVAPNEYVWYFTAYQMPFTVEFVFAKREPSHYFNIWSRPFTAQESERVMSALQWGG